MVERVPVMDITALRCGKSNTYRLSDGRRRLEMRSAHMGRWQDTCWLALVEEDSMAVMGNVRVRRRATVAIAIGAVAASLALGRAATAWAQTEACTPGQMVDFCRAVAATRAFRLDNGAYTTFAVPGAVL